MKFISRNSNLLIVLRAGLSAQPITGTPAKPTISVRFKDGVADVTQQELVDMMLVHPGFNSDFISAEESPIDPYAALRQPSEPTHVVTDIQFGTPMSRQVKGGKPAIPAELQKLIQESAAEMAKQMLPSMVEATLKSLLGSQKEAPKVKGKRGRKPKVKVAEVPVNKDEIEEVFGSSIDPRMQESV
jgi:hypothetical protein